MTQDKLKEIIAWLREDMDVRGDTFADWMYAECQKVSHTMRKDYNAWFYRCCGAAESARLALQRMSPFDWDEWEETSAVFIGQQLANGAPTTMEFDNLMLIAEPMKRELEARWCKGGNREFVR